jgi:hypothetical protein
MSEMVGQRSRASRHVLVVICIAAVSVAALFSRRTGACGTAHYLFFRLFGALIANAITTIWDTHYGTAIEQAAGFVLNVAAFSAIARLWYIKAPEHWYRVGLIVWTVFYLGSYFFFFPTRDCP